jgi:hypothetical protein
MATRDQRKGAGPTAVTGVALARARRLRVFVLALAGVAVVAAMRLDRRAAAWLAAGAGRTMAGDAAGTRVAASAQCPLWAKAIIPVSSGRSGFACAGPAFTKKSSCRTQIKLFRNRSVSRPLL